MTPDEITHRFKYHPPTGDFTRISHENVREQCERLGQFLARILPDGREKSTAITKLEETMMWANAAIARNGGPQ